MLAIGLNHMTMPGLSTPALMDAAKSAGCLGVELRNDLPGGLFDGLAPAAIRAAAEQRGLRILSLSEVGRFNDNTADTRAQTRQLAQMALDCGAEAINLIPRVATAPVPRDTQRAALRETLVALRPMLEDLGVTALIEPLGFTGSSLRLKADAAAVLEDLGRPACFGLVHDSFHHAIAGETEYFAGLTRLVHISGITAPGIALPDMADADRGFVDGDDRLGNIAQIRRLQSLGYRGPFSFEAFSPDVHKMRHPTEALVASMAFITSQVTETVA